MSTNTINESCEKQTERASDAVEKGEGINVDNFKTNSESIPKLGGKVGYSSQPGGGKS